MYLTLCDSFCSLLGSSLHGDSPGKNTGLSCHALLQGMIFPTQRSNPSLLHCRWINNSDSPTKPMWTITWKIILNILSLSIKKVESTFHILIVWNISSKNAVILYFLFYLLCCYRWTVMNHWSLQVCSNNVLYLGYNTG